MPMPKTSFVQDCHGASILCKTTAAAADNAIGAMQTLQALGGRGGGGDGVGVEWGGRAGSPLPHASMQHVKKSPFTTELLLRA